jgi:ribonuclease T1
MLNKIISNLIKCLLVFAICTGVAQAKRLHLQQEPGEILAIDLPKEAQQTLLLIKQGGPFPYAKDGVTFSNREKRLPKREKGYYREYTVPTPGAKNRGKRRIIAGQLGEFYYTADHYKSFKRIRE